jgi:hypothetical protein
MHTRKHAAARAPNPSPSHSRIPGLLQLGKPSPGLSAHWHAGGAPCNSLAGLTRWIPDSESGPQIFQVQRGSEPGVSAQQPTPSPSRPPTCYYLLLVFPASKPGTLTYESRPGRHHSCVSTSGPGPAGPAGPVSPDTRQGPWPAVRCGIMPTQSALSPGWIPCLESTQAQSGPGGSCPLRAGCSILPALGRQGPGAIRV